MKPFLTGLFFALAACSAGAPATTPEILTTGLQAPESAYYDAETQQTFVSNINGNPGDKDGNGWIAVLERDTAGAVHPTKIVDGLDAPKGIIVRDGILWVTDIDQVVKIDFKARRILAKIPVPGAGFLNDPALDDDGTLYVSDTIRSRIYSIKHDVAAPFADSQDLEGPNGLLVKDGKLYVAAWGFITDPATFGAPTPGHLYSLDLKTKAKQLVTAAPLGNLDGLVVAPNGDFIVTDYAAGKIYDVTPGGAVTQLADGLSQPADVGINGHTLLIPEMAASRVSTLELK